MGRAMYIAFELSGEDGSWINYFSQMDGFLLPACNVVPVCISLMFHGYNILCHCRLSKKFVTY